MATVHFTANLLRHVPVAATDAAGQTVREALDEVFAAQPTVRGYILEDDGAVRHHVVIFVNGAPVRDRQQLSDPIAENDQIYVMQALSGG